MNERPQQMPVAVLAGGGPEDKVAAAVGAPCKALAEAAGRPLVTWVIDALRAAERVSQFVVVEGPDGGLSEQLGDQVRVVPARGPAFLDTVLAAADALPESERIVLVTADLPLLTPQAIDDFISSCLPSQAELLYAIVAADVFDRALPGRGKTVVKLGEGRFTGGSAACVSRRFILDHGSTIARTFARRKSKVGLVRMFGGAFLVKLALGQLSIADLEKRASAALGCTARAIRSEHPHIAFDVDDQHDLELAEQFLVCRRDGGQYT